MPASAFSKLFDQHVRRSPLTNAEIAQRLNRDTQSHVNHHNNINNWRRGSVPRQVATILDLAIVLNLNAPEADELILAGRNTTLEQLASVDDPAMQARLAIIATRIAAKFPMGKREFTGRAETIAQAAKALRTGSRSCTIVGMGGIGKSEFAIQLANHLRNEFPDGMILAEVGESDGLMATLDVIARKLGDNVVSYDTVNTRSKVVRQIMSERQALFLLDDVQARQDFLLLHPSEGQCATIVTAREKSVADQSKTTIVSLPPLPDNESSRLLEAYVGQTRKRDAEDDFTRLVQFADGLPLALEIMGTFLRETEFVTLCEYANDLEDERDLLNQLQLHRDTVEEDHNPMSVRASFAISFRRLDALTQSLFALMGAFPSDVFSLDAIVALSPLGALETKVKVNQLFDRAMLLNKQQLLTLQRGNVGDDMRWRIQIHSLLQVFAREKLESDLLETQRRVARYYVDFVGQFSAENHPAIDIELKNILAIMAQLIKQKEWLLLARLVDALTILTPGSIGYLNARGLHQEAMAALSALLNGSDVQLLGAARWQTKAAGFAFYLSKYEETAKWLAQAEKSLDGLQQDREWKLLNGYRAEIAARLLVNSDLEAAHSELENATELLRTMDESEANILGGYLLVVKAMVFGRMGLYDNAKQVLKEGVQHLPDMATPAGLVAILNQLAIATLTGESETCQKLAQQGLPIAEAMGHEPQQAKFHLNLAISEQHQGNIAKAIQHSNKAFKLYSRMGDVVNACGALINLAMAYRIEGKHVTALGKLDLAATLSSEGGFDREQAHAVATLAQIEAEIGRYEDAQNNIELAKELCKVGRVGEVYPYVYIAEATASLHKESYAAALESALAALELVDAKHYPLEAGIVSSLIGQAQDGIGNAGDALVAHQQALFYLKRKDVFERELATVAYLKFLANREGVISAEIKQQIDSCKAELERIRADDRVIGQLISLQSDCFIQLLDRCEQIDSDKAFSDDEKNQLEVAVAFFAEQQLVEAQRRAIKLVRAT